VRELIHCKTALRLRKARRVVGLACSCVAILASRPARAEDPAEEDIPRGVDRPHTLAQLGVGFLTLPGADVRLKGQPTTKGDSSIELDVWQLYRANRHFAIGAGATVAIKPTTDNPQTEAGIDRSHTRSYYLVEGQGRYYALHTETFEAWMGATVGGVIVSDRYSIEGGDTPTAAIIGPRASTLRTEGGTVGALLGAQWSFAPNWALGLNARYMRWFLPSVPATTVFLDRATLTDQQSAVVVGISCSYRIAL
jgi:hypothetical protein